MQEKGLNTTHVALYKEAGLVSAPSPTFTHYVKQLNRYENTPHT
jgi:hypothetical protein